MTDKHTPNARHLLGFGITYALPSSQVRSSKESASLGTRQLRTHACRAGRFRIFPSSCAHPRTSRLCLIMAVSTILSPSIVSNRPQHLGPHQTEPPTSHLQPPPPPTSHLPPTTHLPPPNIFYLPRVSSDSAENDKGRTLALSRVLSGSQARVDRVPKAWFCLDLNPHTSTKHRTVTTVIS